MNEQASSYKPTFTSSGSALRTLRAGKRNPNWQAAAEFLLERAAPDVKLLVEAAAQIEKDKLDLRTEKRPHEVNKSRPLGTWFYWVLLGVGGLLLLGLLVWILNNAHLRAC